MNPVKLYFFKHFASILKEFLVCFQTDRPMLPFLAASLDQTLRRIIKKFVSTKVLEEASTPYKLIKVDLSKKDLGTATKQNLKAVGASKDKKIKPQKACSSMLKAIVEKMQEKCPLKYLVVRNASCLEPTSMINQPEVNKMQFSALVANLYSCKWIVEKSTDRVKLQYDDFLSLICKQNRDTFLQFKWKEDRLDEFLDEYLHRNEKYQDFWYVCKVMFMLSHGQSSIGVNLV